VWLTRVIVYLVGFMGAGKTTVGERLAELLRWSFVDLDRRIEQREGEAIRDLFRRKGEPYFRRVEREELRRASTGSRTVVALGGGAFCSSENQQIVHATGASIWLDAPLEMLFARCGDDQTRPLFTTREEMQQLLDQRRPFYAQAGLHIEVAGLTVDEISHRIHNHLALLGAFES
jgi:shikimate kinase